MLKGVSSFFEFEHYDDLYAGMYGVKSTGVLEKNLNLIV